MTITFEYLDLIYIVCFVVISAYGFRFVFKLADDLAELTHRLDRFEGEVIPPDNLIKSIERLSSQVHHLRFASIDKASPDSIKNFDLIGRITHLLLFDAIYNLEELKTMAVSFSPPLNGEIDYSTVNSAARGIVDAMVRQGRWKEVENYIKETRPNWDL